MDLKRSVKTGILGNNPLLNRVSTQKFLQNRKVEGVPDGCHPWVNYKHRNYLGADFRVPDTFRTSRKRDGQ